MPVLSQLYLYPVKSLAGISVSEWPVDKNGLRFDRKWMLIDAERHFLSQRHLPRMALIKTRIEADTLILSAPSQDDLRLPLHPESGDDIDVVIWRDHCCAKTVSAEADVWLSRFLQTECRLVYHPEDRQRLVDQNYAKPEDQTAFSDGFPFLILSEASLSALNLALENPVTILRFRPNLVIADCEAYAEDSWRLIKINDIEFRLPKPCSRCAVPGIDPETAIRDKETLTTINRLRRWQDKVYFGQNALHDRVGTLKVGDTMTILAKGDKRPPIN